MEQEQQAGWIGRCPFCREVGFQTDARCMGCERVVDSPAWSREQTWNAVAEWRLRPFGTSGRLVARWGTSGGDDAARGREDDGLDAVVAERQRVRRTALELEDVRRLFGGYAARLGFRSRRPRTRLAAKAFPRGVMGPARALCLAEMGILSALALWLWGKDPSWQARDLPGEKRAAFGSLGGALAFAMRDAPALGLGDCGLGSDASPANWAQNAAPTTHTGPIRCGKVYVGSGSRAGSASARGQSTLELHVDVRRALESTGIAPEVLTMVEWSLLEDVTDKDWGEKSLDGRRGPRPTARDIAERCLERAGTIPRAKDRPDEKARAAREEAIDAATPTVRAQITSAKKALAAALAGAPRAPFEETTLLRQREERKVPAKPKRERAPRHPGRDFAAEVAW